MSIDATVSSSADPVRGRRRAPAIDGIRGYAALALLTVHVAMFTGLLGTRAFGEPRPPSNVVGAFFVSGLPSFIGVFFVVPALFLYLPHAKAIISGTPRPAVRNNLLRRLVRLLPAYYVMFIVVLFALNRDAIGGLWDLLRPVLLLQVFAADPRQPLLLNGMEITWTVPTMVAWYSLLPFIAMATHKFAKRGVTAVQRARRLMLPVPILIVLGVGWLFFVKAQGWDNRMVFWWPQGFAPTIGIGIALAAMLALSQVSPGDTPKLFRVAAVRPNLFLLGALAVYLVNCARPFSVIGMDGIYSVSGLLVTYIMVALFGFFAVVPLIAPGARSRLADVALGNRPAVFIGKVSYGIYLWHFAVMHFYLQPGNIGGDARPLRELYGTSGFWQLQIVTVLGAVLLATLSYALVEQPAMRWFEQFLRRRRDGAPTGRRRVAGAIAKRPGGQGRMPEPAVVLTAEQTDSAVADAQADRDAIRANLLDLESSDGMRVLVGSELTGETRQASETVAPDLSRLWEIFTAYSAVVDRASDIHAGAKRHGRETELSGLLTGRAVLVSGTPAPLDGRRITDTRHTQVTLGTAVDTMNEIFTRTAGVVTRIERITADGAAMLDRVDGDLDLLERRAREVNGAQPPAVVAMGRAVVARHRELLRTDPLSAGGDGEIDGAEIASLRRDIASALASIEHPGEPERAVQPR